MQAVDNLANEALQIHLGNSRRAWTRRTRSAWSRFITGTLFRTPEQLARARSSIEEVWLDDLEKHQAAYESWKTPDHPDFLDYILQATDRGTMRLAQTIIDSKVLGPKLNAMRWFVVDTSTSGHRLFTSDRPIIMTNGLGYPGSHLAIAISPTRVFMACNSEAEERNLRSIPVRELVKHMNRHVVRRAIKYAWNVDDRELSFVEKHLSKDAHFDREFFEAPPNRALISDRYR